MIVQRTHPVTRPSPLLHLRQCTKPSEDSHGPRVLDNACRMLIINADDFGASRSATDAISQAFEAGAITSSSAMVWMKDTARSSQIASEHRLPLGLHLNLTLPFDSPDTPPAVRDRQRRLTEIFTKNGWREVSKTRPTTDLLREAIRDQLECFRQQFGPPTHIDGHHHVHLHEAVLELLPRTWPIRPVPRRTAEADARPGRRERRLRARFIAPDSTFGFEHVHPALGGSGLDLLLLAHSRCIEVITHPRRQVELDALLGSAWTDMLATLPLGCYADLTPTPA
jgi:chitin disaccharide deacetylase